MVQEKIYLEGNGIMEEMYRTVRKVAASSEIKEKLIRKEQERRIKECEKELNKVLADKFYQKLTNKMWVRIANKKFFYVESGENSGKNKDIKLLITDNTRTGSDDGGNAPYKIEGYKCRLLKEEEINSLFAAREEEWIRYAAH